MSGRIFSMIHTDAWIDPRMKKLDANTKLARMYLLSNHHGNAAGFSYFNPSYGAIDLTLPEEVVVDSISKLKEFKFVRHNPETNALLVREWFHHNNIGSSTNAQYFIKLHQQRRLPQNEPAMELEFFRNLAKAAVGKEDNDNFTDFFKYLHVNLARLEPDAMAVPVQSEETPDQVDIMHQRIEDHLEPDLESHATGRKTKRPK